MDKMALIEEILDHLSGHQAKGLKDLLDKSKMPKEMPKEGPVEGVEVEVIKPKEGIEDAPHPEMDKKPGEEMDGEMTDDELSELLKRIC